MDADQETAEVRGQRSEVRGQRSEVRDSKDRCCVSMNKTLLAVQGEADCSRFALIAGEMSTPAGAAPPGTPPPAVPVNSLTQCLDNA